MRKSSQKPKVKKHRKVCFGNLRSSIGCHYCTIIMECRKDWSERHKKTMKEAMRYQWGIDNGT